MMHYSFMELAKYMTTHGLTDSAFAAKIGVDRSVVSKLRVRTLGASIETAVKIIDATGGAVTAHDLVPVNRKPAPSPEKAA
jgi:DNA-binding transcriptional regulator YdaS (Cro superfamily)